MLDLLIDIHDYFNYSFLLHCNNLVTMSKLPALETPSFPNKWDELDINQQKKELYLTDDYEHSAYANYVITKTKSELTDDRFVPAQVALQLTIDFMKSFDSNDDEFYTSEESNASYFGDHDEDKYPHLYLNRWISSLRYNVMFDLGFLVFGDKHISSESDSLCQCPCAKWQGKWREMFGLTSLLEKDICTHNKNMKRESLLLHLEMLGNRGAYLHYMTHKYLTELYPSCITTKKKKTKKSTFFNEADLTNHNNYILDRMGYSNMKKNVPNVITTRIKDPILPKKITRTNS